MMPEAFGFETCDEFALMRIMSNIELLRALGIEVYINADEVVREGKGLFVIRVNYVDGSFELQRGELVVFWHNRVIHYKERSFASYRLVE